MATYLLALLACGESGMVPRTSPDGSDASPSVSSPPSGPSTPSTPSSPPEVDSGANTDTLDTVDTDTGAEPAFPQVFCSVPEASMVFSPPTPGVGALDVSVTAPVGYVYVGMIANPPTGWTEAGYAVTGSGPFTWTFSYVIDVPGRYDFAFSADAGTLAVCAGSVWVR